MAPANKLAERSGADVTSTNEEDLFDVELDRSDDKPERRGGAGGNFKRQKKNEKFGFGGKKRHAKSGDAVSSGDLTWFSAKRMKKGGPGGGPGGKPKTSFKTARLGKNKRQARR